MSSNSKSGNTQLFYYVFYCLSWSNTPRCAYLWRYFALCRILY